MRKLRIRPSNQWLWCGAVFVVFVTAYFGIVPLVVQFHCNRARASLDRRQDLAALKELRTALRLKQDSAEVCLLLARAHRRRGNLDRASVFLRRAEKSGGDAGRIGRETWLVSAQAGDLQSSEPHLGELLADTRNDGPDICEAYVQGYFANLRVDEAFELLDAWQRDYPDDPQSHWMEGYLCQALGMLDEAVAAYRRGLELAPQRTAMRCRLAQVLLELQETDEAMSLLKQCIRETPESSDVLTTLAGGLASQGQLTDAGSMLRHVLDDDPNDFEALRQSGEIELTRGEFERAVEFLERAIRERPHDTTTHNALGKALRTLGRDEAAQPHFDYVAEAEPSLAKLEREMRLVVERPKDVELRYRIGVTLLKYGSPVDGAKWLQTVLQLDPDHAATRELLAAYRKHPATSFRAE